MADKEDGSFILSPEKLAGFKPGKGGEILLLTQDDMRLVLSGYYKPVSDLPEELLDQLQKLRMNRVEINRVLNTFIDQESPLYALNIGKVTFPLITLLNGDKYEGEWDLLGRMHGKGVLTTTIGSHGVRYEGTFQAGKKEG